MCISEDNFELMIVSLLPPFPQCLSMRVLDYRGTLMSQFELILTPFRPDASPSDFFACRVLLQELHLLLAQEGWILEETGSFQSPTAHTVFLTLSLLFS